MFTGIVEEIGSIINITSTTLTILAKKILEDTKIGDSISVNGVCLTVTNISDNSFSVDVMPETHKTSNISELKLGSRVNLERALTVNSRIGGHIVTGHVDAVGIIVKKKVVSNATILTIKTDKEISQYIVKKGSIAVDGVSLTIVDTEQNNFSVSIIPQTSRETVLLEGGISKRVNIETDIIGKYILSTSLNKYKTENKISYEYLNKYGFI